MKPDRLLQAVGDFVQASSWTRVAELLQQQPELLGRAAAKLLARMLRDAQKLGDPAAVALLRQRQALLRHCRTVGVDRALAEAAEMLLDLGADLFHRYQASGDAAELDAAIDRWQVAASLTTPESALWLSCLNNLGSGLLARVDQGTNPGDLEHAVVALELVVRHAPPDDPERPGYLTNLGNGLLQRYATSGEAGELDRAIALFTEAVERTPQGSSSRPGLQNNLALGLLDRYAQRGEPTDLERAVDLLQRAVDHTSEAIPDYWSCLGNLGIALRERYARSGSSDDLERAIDAGKKATTGLPGGSLELAWAWNNLGGALEDRYLRDGDLNDLQEALRCYEKAVAKVPPGSPDQPQYMSSLGGSLWRRYLRLRDPEDLERSVALLEQAVSQETTLSPERPRFLSDLGNSLSARSSRTGDIADLDRAVAVYREAVASTPTESPDWPRYSSNLGSGYFDRYQQTSSRADLERAIGSFEAALAAMTHNASERAACLNNLGAALQARHADSGEDADLEHAVAAFREASTTGLANFSETTLTAARNWGDWALQRRQWPEAAEAFGYGLEAMQRLFSAQVLRQYKEAWLRDAEGLPSRAAYARASNGDSEGAALAFEVGRALLLSEALERDRADLERLVEIGQTHLVDRYRRASERLAALGRPTHERESGRAGLAADGADTGAAARADFAAVIDAIREVPGYHQFLRPPQLRDIQAAAVDHPLVYLSATEVGGLALLISSDDVRTVQLPTLTEAELRRQVETVRVAHDRRRVAPDAWLHALDAVTSWLWGAVMGPLVEALQSASAVVLVPGGLLGLLPLHAAWVPDPAEPSGRRYVLDWLAVSYAPNARALTAAQANGARSLADSLLAVDQPTSAHAGRLPFTAGETAAVSAHFERRTRLSGDAATREAVLAALASHRVHHLACHGISRLRTPLESALLLADDQPLALRDLLELRLAERGDGGARLAVLSACETQVAGTDLPDEVVSLPAGLLQAGLGGVIASQWAVSGLATALLMISFYRHWRVDGRSPPEALREAQRWLRDSTNGEKATWLRNTDLPEQAARPLWRAIVTRPPARRDHAHVVAWASFVHVGA